jgi:hypothetical protein
VEASSYLAAGEDQRRSIHAEGNGGRKYDAVKKRVDANVDVAAWRWLFVGDDPEARDFFDRFSYPGLVTTAFAQLWPR